jgi:NADH dehydrogenase
MKVVIVGGGFGGVKAALELAKDSRMQVTLVSDRDHFLFYPTLYSTATGRSRLQSILPLDTLFSKTRVKVVQDTVIGIDTARRIIVAKDHQLPYDRAVFALGVVTSYFGISGLDTYSYSIKSAHEIERFKRHLHDELTSEKHLDKNYIVVGAGPTGVELSASLADYLRTIADTHRIKHSKIRLNLVEAAPRVLPRLSEAASHLVESRLKRLGVTVMTNKKVESEDDDSIIISGKDIPSKTVVWTSGVANHPFFAEHNDVFPLAKNGRVEVDEHLKIDSHIYVIGDNANTPYTGLAQTAIYDGIYVARAIKAESHRQPLPTYKPRRSPVVIPVGTNWALLEYGPIRLTGFPAAVIRRFADLVGFLDFFSLPTAFRLWLLEEQRDEDCEICRRR